MKILTKRPKPKLANPEISQASGNHQFSKTLKLKTEQLEETQSKLKDWQSEAVSTVKLSYRTEKIKWTEFGIKASK